MDEGSVVHDALVLDHRACACGSVHTLDVGVCGSGCDEVLCNHDVHESDRDDYYVLEQVLSYHVLLLKGDQQELLFS